MLDEEACEKALSWFVEATTSFRSTGDVHYHIDYARHTAVGCKRCALSRRCCCMGGTADRCVQLLPVLLPPYRTSMLQRRCWPAIHRGDGFDLCIYLSTAKSMAYGKWRSKDNG